MTDLLVLHTSDRGQNLAAARAAAEGASSVEGCRVHTRDAREVGPEEVLAADGLLLGVSVRMGSAHSGLRQFSERVLGPLWTEDRLVGRVAGVFGTGGGFGAAGAGGELALLTALGTLAELGMVLVPCPKSTPGYAHGGLHWGPLLRTCDDSFRPVALSQEQTTVVRRHGAHVARVAAALANERDALFRDEPQLVPSPQLRTQTP